MNPWIISTVFLLAAWLAIAALLGWSWFVIGRFQADLRGRVKGPSKHGVHGRAPQGEPPTDLPPPPTPGPPPPILYSHDPSRVIGHVENVAPLEGGGFVVSIGPPRQQRILIFDNEFGAGLSVAAMERIVAEAGLTVAWLKHRDHPDLIRIVEDMGSEAVLRVDAVKIVEVPAGVKWEVEIEGRREVIVEKHRTWGWDGETNV